MTDRFELETAILDGQHRFDELTRDITEQALETEPVCGEWAVKAVAWHLADWIEEMLIAGQASVDGVLVERHPLPDIDAFNREQVSKGADVSWEESSARLQRMVQRSAAFVRDLDDAQLELPAILPWGGEGTLAKVIAGIPWHHGEHIKDIERWLEESGA